MSFTILMANYNEGKNIQQAINSILYQTFQQWQLVIIDDASTDDSVKVITPYLRDNRIKLIQNTQNLGYGQSLRIGVEHTGEIFGTLDSDDTLAENAIEIMYKAHQQYPNASMIYSQFINCDPHMKPIKKGYCGVIPDNQTNLEANKVSHFRTYKLSLYNQTSGFHETLRSAIDKDISYKMEEVGDLVFIDEVLYLYRKNSKGISQAKNRKTALNNMAIAKKEAVERRKRRL